jgi:hypothetical protein
VAAQEPSDEEIVARLRSASPADVAALRAAVHEVRRAAAAGPLFTWPDPRGDGTAEHPLQWPHPVYHPSVLGLDAALVAVDACPIKNFDWRNWPGVPRLSTPAAVSAAPLADVARMVTAILRAERFTDGIIATMLDEGILLAAADRILAELTAAP